MKYKWKRCITGSLDLVNKKNEPVFHIFRRSFYEDKCSGQVFYKKKYAKLLNEDTIELFILKAIVTAKELGWDIDFSDISLSPNFNEVESYESLMFKNELSEEDKEVWRIRIKIP